MAGLGKKAIKAERTSWAFENDCDTDDTYAQLPARPQARSVSRKSKRPAGQTDTIGSLRAITRSFAPLVPNSKRAEAKKKTMSASAAVVLQYVCPSLGCLMASIMFAAPVQDLRRCLIKGELGDLNPFPFVMMTGNCLGWTVYGYYTRDPFVVAANIPGLVLSLWLNISAAKLQYYAARKAPRHAGSGFGAWDAVAVDSHERSVSDNASGGNDRTFGSDLSHEEDLIMVPQERALLRILCLWVVVIVYVGWFTKENPAALVGLVVNINLVFFYGAPLQTVFKVISERNSASIHAPTMIMNWMNTTFWIAYGLARRNPVIVIPNGVGLLLGLVQGLLRLVYPASHDSAPSGRHDLIPQDDVDGDGSPSDDGVDDSPRNNRHSPSSRSKSRQSLDGSSPHEFV